MCHFSTEIEVFYSVCFKYISGGIFGSYILVSKQERFLCLLWRIPYNISRINFCNAFMCVLDVGRFLAVNLPFRIFYMSNRHKYVFNTYFIIHIYWLNSKVSAVLRRDFNPFPNIVSTPHLSSSTAPFH